MNEVKEIIKTLHPLERKVAPLLRQISVFSELVRKSGLKDIEVMRALQWLQNKDVLKIKEDVKEVVTLGGNGKKALEKGLPELVFLNCIKHKAKLLDKIQEETGLSKEEINACIGLLKGKATIHVGAGMVISINDNGRKLLGAGSFEENLLKKISEQEVDVSKLKDEEKFAFENLKRRKDMVKPVIKKEWHIILTDLGKKLATSSNIQEANKTIEQLTPTMLKTGSWKNKDFRAYDIKANVPKVFGGKRHPYAEFVDKVRQKLVEMGFKEMEGPIIELEFYNFDALYQPQNHPARTWSATYKIKEPKYGRLPAKKIVEAVKKTHENGGKTGSTGWQYKWSEKTASQLMPRAHDTAISPRYMSQKLKIPGKYFSLVRCFRPDVIDATHGVEFNQLGGFIIGKELTFKHLLGILRDTVVEMTGIKEVKFFPDYFPFTEPSVQISAKHPEFGWMELAGAGIFRPELSEPLGIKEPVIAWGFGIDRLAMLKLGITDIRELFSQNLDFLRKSKKVQL